MCCRIGVRGRVAERPGEREDFLGRASHHQKGQKEAKMEALALERAIPLTLHLLRAADALKGWKGPGPKRSRG